MTTQTQEQPEKEKSKTEKMNGLLDEMEKYIKDVSPLGALCAVHLIDKEYNHNLIKKVNNASMDKGSPDNIPSLRADMIYERFNRVYQELLDKVKSAGIDVSHLPPSLEKTIGVNNN